LAAYLKQINDIETERKFILIKLRAWRRIGELFAQLDFSDCTTQSERIRKIQNHKPFRGVIEDVSPASIDAAMHVAQLSEQDYEAIITNARVTGSLSGLMAEIRAARRTDEEDVVSGFEKNMKRQREVKEEQQRDLNFSVEVYEASRQSLKEVGVTLERRDRLKQKPFVFLIREEVHELMRQAAFDHKITMHEVLRRGLKMWMKENNYDWPEEEVE
jgi:hypothetical protein